MKSRNAPTEEILARGDAGQGRRPYPQEHERLAQNSDPSPSDAFWRNQTAAYGRKLDLINRQLFDSSRPFDIYRPQSLAGDSEQSLSIPCAYESDRIESVIITGPAGQSGTAGAAIPSGVSTTSVTLPPGTSLAGIYASTIPGAGTTSSVTVSGIAGSGSMTFEFTQTASGAGSLLNFTPPVSLQPANNAVGIVVTFNGDAQDDAGYLNAYYSSGENGTPFTLQLGGRAWNLLLPSTGILVIPQVTGFELSQSDTRQLTTTVPGDWSVELMGHAHTQYRDI